MNLEKLKTKRGLPYILTNHPQFNKTINNLILISKVKNPINNSNTKKYKGYKEICLRQASGGASSLEGTGKKGIIIPYYYAIKNNIKINESISLDSCTININFKGSLREHQLEAFNDTLNTLKNEGACLLSQKTGSGKTVLSIKMIETLKVRTLIVVNKEFLMNQWIDRIKQFTDITEVGRIQGKIVNTEPDIVIGMLQSISLKNYPEEIFKSFDMVIFDEVHNLAGENFSNALFYIGKKRYLLGLSATPERLDGLENIYIWHLNKVLDYRSKIETDKFPIIKTISLKYSTSPENHTLRTGNINSQRMLSDIVNNKVRNEFICDKVLEVLLSGVRESNEEKRKILLISSRREHINTMKTILDKKLSNEIYTSGKYMGGMKNNELKVSSEKDVIIGSISVIKEGFDVPDLNTLIIATPLSEVTQLVGRIFRKNHTKINPLIIDIQDMYSIYISQYYKRNRIYNKVISNNIRQKEVYLIENNKYTKQDKQTVEDNETTLEDFSFLDI